ncbi:MAG: N-acetylneuraminate synthase family protein [Chitinophagaceae bacterium]|nr:N-acetylneuraminate synthase family protein [Chitinophagaceae bacterium]
MRTEIIAEIAQGYEGKPLLAELLVKGAIVAGADAVKLQLVYADELCVPYYPYFDLFKSLQMPMAVWQRLAATVKEARRKFYLDIYGPKSLQTARKLKADGVKISATDFYNSTLVLEAVKYFPKVFISCSGVPFDDLFALLDRISAPEKVVLMYGFQAEPTETRDNHLARIGSLRIACPMVGVGFMDHSSGAGEEAFYLPLMALAQGVDCIEKHITLDHSLQIEDYISALTIDRFSHFVQLVRKMEPAVGSAKLALIDKEIAYKKKAGKVVVAARNLPKGKVLRNTDIALKRVTVTPNDAYLPRKEDVVGKKLKRAVGLNKPVEKQNII